MSEGTRDPQENLQPAIPLQFKDTQIVYTNQIVVLGANAEEVELGICVKANHEPASLVTHRLITSTAHFFRIADLFSSLKKDIETQTTNPKL
jgi:hypothetical protein